MISNSTSVDMQKHFINILPVTQYFPLHQDWLPTKTIQKFTATLEFCCARKNSGVNSQSFLEHNQGAYIWCGQVRKSFRFDKSDLHHNARLCFTSTGDFVVSACVKIKRGNNEEVWWAPSFQSIKVTKP